MQPFVIRLQQAARHHAFNADIDNQIRDTVLSRYMLDFIRKKLFEEPMMILARSLEIAAQWERGETQMAAIKVSDNSSAVHEERIFPEKETKIL